ncbi:MAG: LysE family translocator [Hyphomicrobiales bacterium]
MSHQNLSWVSYIDLPQPDFKIAPNRRYVIEYSNFIISFAIYTIATTATPGPNTVMIVASGANFGIKRTLPHIFGILFGIIVVLAFIGIGFGQVFELYPQAQDILRYIGAAFLLYLAYKIATAKNNLNDNKNVGSPMSPLQAALLQAVNPKVWVVMIGAIGAFMSKDGNNYLELALMMATYAVISLPLQLGWCLFGREIGRFLTSERAFTIFNYSMAALLLSSIIALFL